MCAQAIKIFYTGSAQSDPKFFLEYTNIYIGQPSVEEEDMVERSVSPHECRLRDLTYSAPVFVDVRYTRGDTVVDRKKLHVGRIPIMLRSALCTLTGKRPAQLIALSECPYDPGGYFVIKGTERVVLSQEQLSKNRIILELDPKGDVSAAVTSSTAMRKSRTVVHLKRNFIHMKHNTVGEDVPIVIVFKAMGIVSDQEIVALIGAEDAFSEYLVASLEEAAALGVFTQQQALDYLGTLIKAKRLAGSSSSLGKADEARNILTDVVLVHVPVVAFNYKLKATYMAQMVRRVLLCATGRIALDDKDYYGNKRLELAGQSIALLFEDSFKRFNGELARQADNVLSKPSRASSFDVVKHVRPDIITSAMVQAISTGNWSLKRFKMEQAGMTQQLTRHSYMSAMGLMARVQSQFEKTRKAAGPRALQPSQWGMLCPSDTPEGEACGLAKALALLTHVTTDEESDPVHRLCFDLGMEDIELLAGEEINAGCFLVFLNGLLIGAHRRPHALAFRLRSLRRVGLLGEFVSVYVHEEQRVVNLSTDGGRVCRPLIIVDPITRRPRITSQHIVDLEAGLRDFNSFLADNCIEYVDVSEENNCLVALRDADITSSTTHLEIDPMTILGVVAGLIPYPHHNQSPRNTYQCAMGKQAMGTVALNQLERIDTLILLMCYPQKPLVRTRVSDMIGFDNLPAGQQAIIAVMSYSGYDIEDAIVLNKASLDRGFMRCWVMRKYATQMQSYQNGTYDRVVGAPAEDDPAVSANMQQRLKAVDRDGLAMVGHRVLPNGILVNKESPVNTTETRTTSMTPVASYKPTPLSFKSGKSTWAVVDKVMLTSTPAAKLLIKILTRQLRRPELGDKFSSRHGQKGVCGLISPQADMPFNDEGICPDLIMNPHGFPKRMTVGKLIEMIAGKASVLDGYRRYGTAFGGDKAADISAALVQRGYHYAGKEYLTSGITGEPLKAYVFFGPMYYQKLKHMVMDKMHARATGPVTLLTRQPTEGRSRDGGLRLGEMERDCLIAHGSSMLLQERLMLSSDVFTAYVCTSRDCGGLLGYKGWCTFCRSGKHMTPLRLPYACKLLFQELQAMNIVPRLHLKPMHKR